jgi:hypothetical protein
MLKLENHQVMIFLLILVIFSANAQALTDDGKSQEKPIIKLKLAWEKKLTGILILQSQLRGAIHGGMGS